MNSVHRYGSAAGFSDADSPLQLGHGHIDHSVRVMRVITWHWSFEVTPGADGSKDDFIDDEWETHATVSLVVVRMAKMWQAMHMHHHSQLKMMEEIKGIDISNASEETSEHHHKRTLQLLDSDKEWRSQLHKLVAHQKEYVGALDSWLKLNLIPIESNLQGKVSSRQRPAAARIQTLVHAWHEYLEKLPEELPNTALLSFSAVLNTIEAVQQEELKQKERCREIHKEYLGKKRAFEDWCQNDPVGERRRVVESLKSQLDEEVEGLCKQVREKSLVALKTHLPELFRAVSDFAEFCSNTYTSLQLVTDQQDPPTK
ncbi:hypothetical protein BHM03_00063010 [Ensete ventricosum]|nr:hypothetical protein BHM03_00063010 [Ensete ventricosum]